MASKRAPHGNHCDKDHRRFYEVRRGLEPGKRGVVRPPLVEEFRGLDRARLAALGYALDGPSTTGQRFTGTISIYRVSSIGGRRINSELVDVIDERVAFRVLNELTLPRAADLSVPVERLQEETNRLERLGF